METTDTLRQKALRLFGDLICAVGAPSDEWHNLDGKVWRTPLGEIRFEEDGISWDGSFLEADELSDLFRRIIEKSYDEYDNEYWRKACSVLEGALLSMGIRPEVDSMEVLK